MPRAHRVTPGHVLAAPLQVPTIQPSAAERVQGSVLLLLGTTAPASTAGASQGRCSQHQSLQPLFAGHCWVLSLALSSPTCPRGGIVLWDGKGQPCPAGKRGTDTCGAPAGRGRAAWCRTGSEGHGARGRGEAANPARGTRGELRRQACAGSAKNNSGRPRAARRAGSCAEARPPLLAPSPCPPVPPGAAEPRKSPHALAPARGPGGCQDGRVHGAPGTPRRHRWHRQCRTGQVLPQLAGEQVGQEPRCAGPAPCPLHRRHRARGWAPPGAPAAPQPSLGAVGGTAAGGPGSARGCPRPRP